MISPNTTDNVELRTRVRRNSPQISKRNQSKSQWRRAVKATAAVALCGVVLAGCGSSSPSTGTGSGGVEVKMTDVTAVVGPAGATNGPFYAAEKLGYFKQQGLNVKLVTVTNAPNVISAVASGSAQFAQATGLSFLQSTTQGEKGVDLLAVKGLYTGGYGVEFAVGTKLAASLGLETNAGYEKTMRAFQGKTVAVTGVATTTALELKGILKLMGLPEDWIKLVALSKDASVAALEHGTIDAFFQFQPASYNAVKSGAGVVTFTANDIPGVDKIFNMVLVVQPSYASSHGDVIKKMTTALTMAAQALQDKNQAAVDSVSVNMPGVPVDEVVREVQAGMELDGTMSDAQWRDTADLASTLGIIKVELTDTALQKLYSNDNVSAPTK